MGNGPLRKLTDQHKHLVECYLIHFNKTRAGREAGFSESCAAEYASKLLNDPLVKAYMKERMTAIMSEIGDEQLRVFKELINLATSDIRALYDPAGNILPLDQWPEELARCVSSVKHKQGGKKGGKWKSLEIKLWDKTRSLEILARIVGLVNQDINLNVDTNKGSIYFPEPKEAGAPVDPAVLDQDKKIHLLQGGQHEPRE